MRHKREIKIVTTLKRQTKTIAALSRHRLGANNRRQKKEARTKCKSQRGKVIPREIK